MPATSANSALLALTLLAGALLPLQALINGRLGGALGSPFWASITQNLVGAMAIGSVMLLTRTAPPTGERIAAAPLWSWIGGALGMVYVVSILLAAPRLGATRAMMAVIVGQLAASVLLDQFAILHPRRPVSIESATGLLLLALGAMLVLRRPSP
jgi:transporter family-2 protein